MTPFEPSVRRARPPRQSSAAEFEAFAGVCERLAGFDESASPEAVDGWLTALACGPIQVGTDVWLAELLGDAFERTFADPPDRAQALAVLDARLAVLRDQLDAEALLDDPDALRLDPYLLEWTDEERERVVAEAGLAAEDAHLLRTGAQWAAAVLEGLDTLPAIGATAGDVDDEAQAVHDELLRQIEALLLPPDGDEWRAYVADFHAQGEPTRDDLVRDACYALQDLRIWWLDQAPRPATRRVEAKPGRNDPCPCGSGRKFKKCHGAPGAAS